MLSDELKQTIQTAYRTLLESKELKPRYGQRLMIAEIARTLGAIKTDAEGERVSDAPFCVVEAGTGTGKTVAYALATIPIAKAMGKTVVISTATVALQEQVVYRDLPDILQHSGLSFSYALAKGRGRYLCLSKLDQTLSDSGVANATMALYPDEQAAQLDGDAVKIYDSMVEALGSGEWDGDRDNWKEALEEPVWRRVTTDHAQCTGRRCPHIRQCCFFKSRDEIGDVDVIVTNHDLVLADLALGGGAILPEPEQIIYIFDEGHHLPDKAIDHFSHHSRMRATERWLDQGVKLLGRAAEELGSDVSLVSPLEQLPQVMQELQQQLALVRPSLDELLDQQETFGRELPRCRFEHGEVPPQLQEWAQELKAGYSRMEDLLGRIVSNLEDKLDEGGAAERQKAEEWYSAFGVLRTRASANGELWDQYSHSVEEENPPKARWIQAVEGVGGQIDVEICCSPILGAKLLAYYLWSRSFGAVITSATLTALGRFDRFRLRSGVPSEANFATVPSPFRVSEVGTLVVPAMQSDPGDADAHTDELIEKLPSWLDGEPGSLVLFASKRQMEAVYDGLPSLWQQRIEMQGSYSKQEIIRRHCETIDSGEVSVIFGLASFAEGVDLPGDYCRHVLIAKIPFAVPDQPVEAALAEWVEARGGNPFMEITVPDASVKLVQASGRLLRTETDSGRITLLDRRVVTRRYGQALLDSLPAYRREIG